MATAKSRTLLLFLAALLCASAAVAYSRGHDDDDRERRGPELGRCLRRCDDRPSYERSRCVQDCRQQEHRREQHGHGGHDDDDERQRVDWRRGGDDEREQDEGGSSSRRGRRQQPYVFGRRSFRSIVRSEQGSVRALRPFRHDLLRGVRDYRVAVLEASPRAFVVPSHADAHCIGYVASGEGVVTTIENGERRSYAVREGHVFVAPAGAVTYLANTDGRRKLVIAKVIKTISSQPGKIQFFFGPGGKNPESILSGFSKNVQAAAFQTSSDRVQRIFGRQDRGVIVRASEEQVRELRRHASDPSHGGPHWPLPPFGESRGPYRLLEQRPSIANRHGQLYEADARSFRDLADHDVRVSLVNITAGSMTAPFYNTRSIKIAYVLDGEGHVEIVCPHLAQQRGQSERGKGRRHESEEEEEQQHGGSSSSEEEQEEEAGQGYETIRARLTRGTAFVVPVGHPIVAVASRGGDNLQIVCFEIRAEKNERVYLAGANSVLKQLDGAAKQLAFGAESEREVDEVLGAQREQGFLAGPEEQSREEEGRRGRREEEEGRRGRRGEDVAETLLRMATGGF